MSRSYKKSKVVKDSTKGMKKLANRKVRSYLKRGKELSDGKGYKKVFESYDISDWKFTCEKSCKECEKATCTFNKK